MQYDPIKNSLGKVFNHSPYLRIIFYRLLDLLLLRAWHIKKEIKNLSLPKTTPLNILDAGSGFGQYSHYLARRFPNAVILGVDVKTEQVADCNRFAASLNLSQRLTFEVADLTSFTSATPCDLILSVDVMEHIEEDERVFRNFATSLKPGGTLLISTPSDQGGSDVHHDHEESFIDEHVRDGYNLNDIREKLLRAGFSNISARYSYGKPGSLAWRLSMKYPISLLNLSKAFFILLPLYYLLTFPLAMVLNALDTRITHRSGTGLIVKAVK
jgi:SAM-dependent methyltransferase